VRSVIALGTCLTCLSRGRRKAGRSHTGALGCDMVQVTMSATRATGRAAAVAALQRCVARAPVAVDTAPGEKSCTVG